MSTLFPIPPEAPKRTAKIPPLAEMLANANHCWTCDCELGHGTCRGCAGCRDVDSFGEFGEEKE